MKNPDYLSVFNNFLHRINALEKSFDGSFDFTLYKQYILIVNSFQR